MAGRCTPTVVMTSEEYLQGSSRMCITSRKSPRHSVLFMVTAPYTCMQAASSPSAKVSQRKPSCNLLGRVCADLRALLIC